MLDISLTQGASGYDITITNGDLTGSDSFKTAIEVSLFSDARADASQVALPEARRGWVGDLVSPIEGQKYGSQLWLLGQERLTQSTLNKAVNFARLSLQWVVDEKKASSIEVSGEIVPQSGITLKIIITSTLGLTESHYVEIWENTVNGN